MKFGDFFGGSLEIETTGTIEGGDVVLNDIDDTSEPSLVLNSGIEDKENSAIVGFDYTNLGFGTAYDINNLGQVVGYLSSDSGKRAYLYSDGEIQELGTFSETYNDVSSTVDNNVAYAINDLGQITGYGYPSFDSDPDNYRAFVYENNQIKNLGVVPGQGSSLAIGLNNSGQIVGPSRAPRLSLGTSDYAFIYDDNQISHIESIPVSRVGTVNARDINDSGEVVGYFSDNINGSPYARAFVVTGGQYQELGTLPGQRFSQAYSINNLGQVVGSSYGRRVGNTFYESAFLYSDAVMEDLGVLLGGTESKAYDINNLGQVVGFSNTFSRTQRAVIFYQGEVVDLNNFIVSEDNVFLREAWAINDKSQIVGRGVVDSSFTSFLLNPVTIGSQGNAINIGNISTYGDSVLLDGEEITLTGDKIKTRGGDIFFDGATKVNSSSDTFIFNSSVGQDDTLGGDIALLGTLDGSNDLTIKAGKGDIFFGEEIGSNNAFLDFKVSSANTVIANQDITSVRRYLKR